MLLLLPSMISAPFLYGIFKAVEWRWWVSGIRFGDVRFGSSLSGGALIGLYWKVIGWLWLLGLLFAAFEAVSLVLVWLLSDVPIATLFAPGKLYGRAATIVPVVIGYLAYILAMNAVMRIYLQRDVWARVVASTVIHNIEAASNVSAEGELASALGEGFADGLDVVGF